jgi:hypothetical protein
MSILHYFRRLPISLAYAISAQSELDSIRVMVCFSFSRVRKRSEYGAAFGTLSA